MTFAAIERRISGGESATLELEKSTGQLNRAGETLCAFLNGDGGTVIVGVTPEGRIVGQEVTDKTRREIAAMLARFEPPPLVEIEYVDVAEGGRKLIVLEARREGEVRPFTFDGRPYQRVETTTSRMPQERYKALLLNSPGNCLGKSSSSHTASSECFIAPSSLANLRVPPTNRLERLKGDRLGQYSIRINDQWRIRFRWDRGDAMRVEIVGYH